jgi:23S rRNA pseudouridine2604 synthase
MNIELDVPVGKYRELTSEEFKTLTDLVSDSKKTFQPQINRIKRK